MTSQPELPAPEMMTGYTVQPCLKTIEPQFCGSLGAQFFEDHMRLATICVWPLITINKYIYISLDEHPLVTGDCHRLQPLHIHTLSKVSA